MGKSWAFYLDLILDVILPRSIVPYMGVFWFEVDICDGLGIYVFL